MHIEIEVFHNGTGMIENYKAEVPSMERDVVLAAYNKAFADSMREADPEAYVDADFPPAVCDAWVEFPVGRDGFRECAFVFHDSKPDFYFGEVRLTGFVREINPPTATKGD